MKILEEGARDTYEHSTEEVRDLIVSTLVLGFVFTIVLFSGSRPLTYVLDSSFLPHFVIASLVVGVTLLSKELAQKGTTRALEAHATYELWTPGVVISVLSSFLGIAFTAVSGVRIASESTERYGRWQVNLSVQQLGIVGAIGPLMSLSLGMAFLMLEPLSPGVPFSSTSWSLFGLAAQIQAFMALFSMVPLRPIDGAKVLRWSITIWAFIILMCLAVMGLVQGWI